MQAGADLYLTKPFNPTFLLESLRTLLRNRDQQREHFRRELSVTTATMAPQRVDQKFLADLTAVIEARLDQPALSVDDIARHLGVSQVQLYRKVKAVLGTGASDYIQNIRLTKARQLLLIESNTIAEVAYQTGSPHPLISPRPSKASTRCRLLSTEPCTPPPEPVGILQFASD